jgi:hypothetical protein
MASPLPEAIISSMNSTTHTNLEGRVNVDDESVAIFLREGERCRVVIAALDEQGRPSLVAEWNPDTGSKQRPQRFRSELVSGSQVRGLASGE